MEDIIQVKYALDTFYFLVMGAFVMWMAAGFAMLEAGLVRAKNTTEILTKNVALYAIACTMYLLIGYHIMYSSPEGGIFPSFGVLIGAENTVEDVLAGGDDAPYYSVASDFFFQVVFVATAMSIVSVRLIGMYMILICISLSLIVIALIVMCLSLILIVIFCDNDLHFSDIEWP